MLQDLFSQKGKIAAFVEIYVLVWRKIQYWNVLWQTLSLNFLLHYSRLAEENARADMQPCFHYVPVMWPECNCSFVVTPSPQHDSTSPNIMICIFKRKDAVNFPPTLLADSETKV